MLHTPHFRLTDADEVKRLIRHHPWATLVSSTSRGLVASHYPVLLDESTDDIVLISHMGRPDDELHELGDHEVLVIVQGPHDYVSASWYEPGEVVPTWNHVTAHLYGVPEIMSEESNYAMLSRLTDHFEKHHAHGRSLAEDEDGTRAMAKGTKGFRIRVTRFQARAKLSQNQEPQTVERVADEIDRKNPPLASEMRRFLSGPPSF